MNNREVLCSRLIRHLFSLAAMCLMGALPMVAGADDQPGPAKRNGAAAIVSPDRWTGHLNYVFGYKKLDSDWSPAENHVEFGLVDFDCRKGEWPIFIAGQFLMTYTGSTPNGLAGNNSGTYELNLGLRKVWDDRSALHPFIGGGVSLIGASNNSFIDFGGGESAQVNEHSAATIGAWGDAGVYWLFGDNWHTGAQIQYSWGELRLGGKDLDAGGFHFLGMIGYHWN